MIRYSISILLMCFSVVGTNAQHIDTLHIKAKVVRIDKIKFYTVIRAKLDTSDKLITVLSPLDEKNNVVIGKKNSTLIRVGKTYNFDLINTLKIKVSKQRYLLLHYQKFYYGPLLLLEEGEIPYLGLNTYKSKLFY